LPSVFDMLHPRLRRLLPRYGYREPTPIQRRAIPVLLKGFNCLIVAPTGMGKTEAAVLPFLSRMIEEGGSGLRLVYITPLRSLNRDLFHRLEGLASELGFRLLVRHGDTSQSVRRAFLREPPDAAIMTPEAFYFLLSVPRFRRIARSIRYVVIDEVHELVYSERGVELVAALERLRRLTGRRIVRAALSATVADPLEVARLISPRDYMVIVEDRESRRGLRVSVVSPERDECGFSGVLGVPSDVAARVCFIARVAREAAGGVLVFANTRDTAEYLGSLLKRVLGDDRVAVHHGSLSRRERVAAEEGFREGRIKVLVATSSLELGIDIGWVDVVIQYASPRQALRLLQRVGRSRHRVGGVSEGYVVSLEGVYDVLESIVLARRTIAGDLEKPTVPIKPLDALLHQLVGMVLEEGCIGFMDAYSFFSSLPYYRGLSVEEFSGLVEYAEAARILRVRDDRICPGRRARSYYYSTTMIPDEVHYVVVDAASREKVGVLDEEFAASLEEGDVFVLAGRVWRVLDVSEGRVYVTPAEEGELVLPSWEGDMIPVEYLAAREMGSLVRRLVEEGVDAGRLAGVYPCDRGLLEKVAGFFRGVEPPPTDRRIVVESSGEFVFVYGFFGSRIAKSFELMLRGLVEEILGFQPASYSTPYAILLRLTRDSAPRVASALPRLLRRLSREEARGLLEKGLRSSRLFEWRMGQVARKMGVVEPGKPLDHRLLRSLRDTVIGVEAVRELEASRLDTGGMLRLLEMIRDGSIEIIYRGPGGSGLAKALIESTPILRAARTAAIPSTLLPEVYRRRLASRRVRLICLMCMHTWERRFAEIEEEPRCPKCGSRFIAPLIGVSAEEAVRMLRRYRASKKGAARRLIELGNLVLSYGKRVIEALLVPGVGPGNVRSILSKLVLGEEAYYKALMEAEQRFLRTRRYWQHR